jgi:hypothetical protein
MRRLSLHQNQSIKPETKTNSIKHHNSKTNQQEHSGKEKQTGAGGSKNHSSEAREPK